MANIDDGRRRIPVATAHPQSREKSLRLVFIVESPHQESPHLTTSERSFLKNATFESIQMAKDNCPYTRRSNSLSRK
jgi:hypothetical protein